jgi:hypothetical protein
MKSIKEYIADVTLCTLLASPLIVHGVVVQYQAHNSGFAKNYNQAIARNADINGNGRITSTEELIFKQNLNKEIIRLKEQGRNLDEIIDWLKIR